MLNGTYRSTPRANPFARCSEFNIVGLTNELSITQCGDGTTGTACNIPLKIEPTVYNGKGAMSYDWSCTGADDNGVHTDATYTLVATGTDEHKDIKVSLTVTDANSSVTITDVVFTLTFGTP